MGYDLLCWSVLAIAAVATVWDLRRAHRFRQESQERIEAYTREIASVLGTDQR